MIEIFTTGGTIDKVYFDALSEYQIGPATIPDLLQENNVFVAHRVTQLMRKDSLDLTDADRQRVHAAVVSSPADKILITHGTDTMAQSGRILANIEGKTIVLTGAMQPATLRNSDADFNVGFALAAVQCLPSGVYIAMNGQLFDPFRVTKDRAGHRFVEAN